jgi:trehalose 6-phosphate synthase
MGQLEQLAQEHQRQLTDLSTRVLDGRTLVLASNRGAVEYRQTEQGDWEGTRGTGGLVTAISAISRYATPVWIAAALTDGDRRKAEESDDGVIAWHTEDAQFELRFVTPSADDYHGYYNEIANPLLWFLQHSMWDAPRTPNITTQVWSAWGAYERVNQLFADNIAHEIGRRERPAVVLLQDYHLYLVANNLRRRVPPGTLLTLFVHIPWPGPDYWALLPTAMRQAILRSCCTLDVIGFHTKNYQRNFLDTVRANIGEAHIDYVNNAVTLDGHTVWARSYPIGLDVPALLHMAETSPVVRDYRYRLRGRLGDQTIIRVDRIEPSKNIVRGFQAFDELLQQHPEHRGRVKFLAFLVPSRLGVDEYARYLEEIMVKVGWINTRYGTPEWQPVELFIGDDYERGIAAMQLYDVLLVNPIVDGMNLVAKEGPTVNATGGVLILGEGAGAIEQLGAAALVVTPTDIVGTAQALHDALTMRLTERYRRAAHLKRLIAEEDIAQWLLHQLHDLEALMTEHAPAPPVDDRVEESAVVGDQ